MEKNRGSLTVFMSLILSLLVALTCTSLESVRMAAARVQILCGMDIGLYSLMAGYDRELLRDYGMFFLDGGYGSSNLDQGKICDTFREYMEGVLRQNYQSLRWKEGGIEGYTLATDGQGNLFYRQAVRYVRDNLGVSGLQLLIDHMVRNSKSSREAEQFWKNSGENGSLSAYEEEMIHASQESHDASIEMGEEEEETLPGEFGDGNVGGGVKPTVENPIPVIQRIQRMGLLGLVLPYQQGISDKKANTSSMVSKRRLNEGMGADISDTEDGLDGRVLFHEYILKKLGNYTKPAEGELSYEAEYVLLGKKSDEENLKGIAKRLLIIREGLNLGFLMANPEKRGQTEALALAIASAFLVPPAQGIITMALLLCWSFAESILDLRALFYGDKTAAIKTAETWQLSLHNLPRLLDRIDIDRKNPENGLDYKDYLRILLFMEKENELCMRCMDMVESRIRISGRPDFSLDTCIGEIQLWADVEANGRKTYSISRSMSYE
ncbi:MAG: DUF5702 domain-containing protein [Eubacteriales bacterium]|nr:DUF5702 domain-containing protein [Eubacteriales bacterium]